MAKYSAFGTTLEQSDMEATPVFTAIAGIQNIGGPELTVDEIDVTAHDSPGQFEEVIATIKRSGEMTLTVVYDPADATHTALKTAYDGRDVIDYRITMPDDGTSVIDFSAFVKTFGREFPFDGAMMANVVLRLTGEVTG